MLPTASLNSVPNSVSTASPVLPLMLLATTLRQASHTQEQASSIQLGVRSWPPVSYLPQEVSSSVLGWSYSTVAAWVLV